jgi:hypothetical protein
MLNRHAALHAAQARGHLMVNMRRLGAISGAGDALHFHTSENEYAKEIRSLIDEFIVRTYGDNSTASYKRHFDLLATQPLNIPEDGFSTEPYWYEKTLAEFLFYLSACAPTSLTSGPQCEATADSIIGKFAKHDPLRLNWEEFREGLKLDALPLESAKARDGSPMFITTTLVSEEQPPIRPTILVSSDAPPEKPPAKEESSALVPIVAGVGGVGLLGLLLFAVL